MSERFLAAGRAALARWRFGAGGSHRFAIAAAGLAAGTLFVLMIALYARTPAPDAGRRGEVLGWLRELKAIDTRWDAEVLRLRAGFEPGPVVDAAPRVTRLREALGAAAREGASPALAQGATGLATALGRKAELFGKFRDAHLATRQALARVMAADVEFAGLVRGSWQDFKDRERLVAAESAVTQLLSESQRYYYNPGEAQRKNVEAVASDLRDAAADLPPALRDGIARLDAKVQQLLGARPVEEGLFNNLAQTNAGPRIDSLAAAYALERESALARGERYRIYLVYLSGALFVLAAYFVGRLVMAQRRMKEAHAALDRRLEAEARSHAGTRARLEDVEAQLVEAEKASALGQMVAGLAHEIATPLGYVKSSMVTLRGHLPALAQALTEAEKLVALLRTNRADSDALARQFSVVQAHFAELGQQQVLAELQRLAQDGLHGIDQVSELIVSLRHFARADHERIASFDLNEGVQNTLRLARHEVKRHAVEEDYGDIPAIRCSPSQINQVILGLINKAAQGIDSERGMIRLTTRREDAAHVALEIEDNGKGIPPDELPRLFDPAFAAREAGRNAGPGLPVLHRIVEAHGGRLTVDSAVGIGTKFRVVLPLDPPAGQLAA